MVSQLLADLGARVQELEQDRGYWQREAKRIESAHDKLAHELHVALHTRDQALEAARAAEEVGDELRRENAELHRALKILQPEPITHRPDLAEEWPR